MLTGGIIQHTMRQPLIAITPHSDEAHVQLKRANINAIVDAGGTLYQDIVRQLPQKLMHRQEAPGHHLFHSVTLDKESLLAQITGVTAFRVNSFHHQAVKNIAPGFRATAWSTDGLIEAIESDRNRYVLGVQWHPEETAGTDEISHQLYVAFVQACGGKSLP